jgi:putative peptidoglycan lipid II flippase
MVGLMLLRHQIIEVLFQHGSFDASSTALTARPLFFFALGLTTISMVKIIVPAFYAMHDTSTPVKVAFISMFLNFGLNLVFIGPLGNGGPALATSLSAIFDSACLMRIFYGRHGGFGLRDIGRSIGKFGASAVVMATVTYFLINMPGFYAGGLLHRVAALGGAIIIATGTYFATAWILRTRELKELWGMYGGSDTAKS